MKTMMADSEKDSLDEQFIRDLTAGAILGHRRVAWRRADLDPGRCAGRGGSGDQDGLMGFGV
jgi:hypothetical protein